jgi:hypothetical protein
MSFVYSSDLEACPSPLSRPLTFLQTTNFPVHLKSLPPTFWYLQKACPSLQYSPKHLIMYGKGKMSSDGWWYIIRGRRSRDRMVVGFTTTCTMSTTTKVVSCSNTAHGEVYSIQHYVIRLVSNLRQVGGFLRVLRFPPPIKRPAMI